MFNNLDVFEKKKKSKKKTVLLPKLLIDSKSLPYICCT